MQDSIELELTTLIFPKNDEENKLSENRNKQRTFNEKRNIVYCMAKTNNHILVNFNCHFAISCFGFFFFVFDNNFVMPGIGSYFH